MLAPSPRPLLFTVCFCVIDRLRTWWNTTSKTLWRRVSAVWTPLCRSPTGKRPMRKRASPKPEVVSPLCQRLSGRGGGIVGNAARHHIRTLIRVRRVCFALFQSQVTDGDDKECFRNTEITFSLYLFVILFILIYFTCCTKNKRKR